MISGSFIKMFNYFKAAGLLFFAMALCAVGFSQTYFHIDAEAPAAAPSFKLFSVFINTDADGSTTARILFADTIPTDSTVIEQKLTDTLIDGKRYMVAAANPKIIRGNNTAAYQPLRFLYTAQTDSLGVYYAPAGVEIFSKDNNWLVANMLQLKTYYYADVNRNLSLLRRYYRTTDPFYLQFTKLGTRGLSPDLLSTTFYFIAVINSNDPSIGVACQKDFKLMYETLSTLAAQLKIRFLPVVVMGDAFNIANTNRVIDTVKPKPTDIVFFYYSGHGFRYNTDDKTKNKYPRISFRTNNLQVRSVNNLAIEDIYKRLLKKNAKTTIVISDCCNENLNALVPFGMDILRPRSSSTATLKLNMENVQALFFPNKKQAILAASAMPDQLAVGHKTNGSFFSSFFQAELVKNIYGGQTGVNWTNLFFNVDQNTERQARTSVCAATPNVNGRCKQNAVIDIK